MGLHVIVGVEFRIENDLDIVKFVVYEDIPKEEVDRITFSSKKLAGEWLMKNLEGDLL